jgi:hypothetical protein
VAFRRRALDDDNLTGGLKPLRDAVAQSLGLDDGDPSLKFTVHQCVGRGPEGVLVRISDSP